MDGWMDGWTDGRMDGRTDGRTVSTNDDELTSDELATKFVCNNRNNVRPTT